MAICIRAFEARVWDVGHEDPLRPGRRRTYLERGSRTLSS